MEVGIMVIPGDRKLVTGKEQEGISGGLGNFIWGTVIHTVLCTMTHAPNVYYTSKSFIK